MADESALQRYVLLPMRGLHSRSLSEVSTDNRDFANTLTSRMSTAALTMSPQGAPGRARSIAKSFQVLHSSGADGPKLVLASLEAITAMHVEHADVRAVPVVTYQLARRAQERAQSRVATAGAGPIKYVTVKVVHSVSGRPVPSANVVAFTNYARRQGDQATTDRQGLAKLRLGSSSARVELLLVYPRDSHWGFIERSILIADKHTVGLRPLELSRPDFVGHLYGKPASGAGKGVTVGVIDTGVDARHPDLVVAGGAAFVAAEQDAGGHGPASTDGDHGTHVAGIIASRGLAPSGKPGIAPEARLFSYRVFPNAGGGAENYDIVRAIERGVADGCDLLNLSLGSGVPDQAVREAMIEAFDAGTVCIVAAGNDGRKPVSYPAAWDEALAISAAGLQDTFPPDATEVLDIAAPVATSNKRLFIAAFSNIGVEIDLSGPGVGIVSTMPGGSYGVMSGTSMACPAVVGAAAARLSQQANILKLPRDRRRALEMAALVRKLTKRWGFPAELEGAGHIP